MVYNPFDSSMRSALEQLEQIRRLTDGIPDAVRQAQQYLERHELRRQLESRWEMVRQFEESQALASQIGERQDLIRQLEGRQDFVRAIEEQQDLYRRVATGPELLALNDFFLQNRGLIDSYVYDTLYGGGPSFIGSTYGLGSFAKSNQQLADAYEAVTDLAKPPASNRRGRHKYCRDMMWCLS